MSSVKVLYHPNSDHERQVTELAYNLAHQSDRQLELVSLETVEGAELAKLYGVVEYPAILVTGPEGRFQKLWQGKNLPLVQEILSYL